MRAQISGAAPDSDAAPQVRAWTLESGLRSHARPRGPFSGRGGRGDREHPVVSRLVNVLVKAGFGVLDRCICRFAIGAGEGRISGFAPKTRSDFGRGTIVRLVLRQDRSAVAWIACSTWLWSVGWSRSLGGPAFGRLDLGACASWVAARTGGVPERAVTGSFSRATIAADVLPSAGQTVVVAGCGSPVPVVSGRDGTPRRSGGAKIVG